MSEGINPKKEDLGIKINTLEVDYEIEKKKVYTQKNSDSEYTFRTGNQADNKSKYLVSIYHKDFSFKGYLSNTLTKEKIGLFNYGNSEDADCYCGNFIFILLRMILILVIGYIIKKREQGYTFQMQITP